jgi:predicted HAD superfamily Cof-like phosphohydrolase
MSHSVQNDVEDFHHALDIPIGDTPAVRRPVLRAMLILEEAIETVEAILGVKVEWRVDIPSEDEIESDLVEAIDGMCDILCVVYGTAVEFGVDLAPFWNEVHHTNMAKRGGPVREDGKRLKPEGWKPPRIAEILESMRA